MGTKLFDGGEEEEEEEEDLTKIEINKEFARRYEHNKKREDLHRYQELKKKGIVESSTDDSSSSSSDDDDEDDDDSDAVNKKDLEFFDALIKVKSQDPALNQKDVVLFHSDEEEEENEGKGNGVKKNWEPKRKEKAYLKDVVAKRLIEEGPELMEESDSDDGNKKKVKTYAQEQEETRRAFLQAVEEAEVDGDGDGDGDFLRVKEGKGGGGMAVSDGVAVEELEGKVDEYFGGEDGNLDENHMFLKEFFLKKMWVDRDSKGMGTRFVADEEEIDELMRDEEELEKQEDYETNFRYEENVGDRILSHSRIVEDSVRKKDNARKKQRKSKEERMKTAEMERKEELKHLKNLKKEEMKEKLDEIKRIAGIAGNEECPFLDGGDLEDEFDPDEYDRMMKAVFDEKYYDAEDADPGFGSSGDEDGEDGDVEKPDFDREDELLGLPKCWDKGESGDGFLAARERSLKHKVDDKDDIDPDDHAEDVEDGDAITHEGERRKRKRKLSLVKRAKEAMLEEFYKLDYEDTIGDLKTRFKYAKIKPNRFGLSTEEILAMDDKELNQYVSLKKIAPYQEKEWKVHNSQRHQLKMKSKELLQGNLKSKKHKPDKRKREVPGNYAGTSTSEMGSEAFGRTPDEGSNGDMVKLSKQARRRRRTAQLKLSHSRLVAYGKITPKSKGKEKIKS